MVDTPVITLITGSPGMGKTSLVVSMLMDQPKDRPIFVDGIPDLKIPHHPAEGDVANWHQWLPVGALLVIDEVQRIFRPRSTGSKVPDGVQAMETHRHNGQDLILITQSPLLLDSNIRRLVGRHIHIKQTPLGRYLYEWPEVGEPESKASRDRHQHKGTYAPPYPDDHNGDMERQRLPRVKSDESILFVRVQDESEEYGADQPHKAQGNIGEHGGHVGGYPSLSSSGRRNARAT